MDNSDTDRMMQMISDYWVTDEITRVEGTDVLGTIRMLRAYASLGLVRYDGKSRFATTDLLDTLRRDSPRTLRGLAMAVPAPGHWLPWGRLPEVIRARRSRPLAAIYWIT